MSRRAAMSFNCLIVSAVLLAGLAWAPGLSAQQAFATPEQAAQALVDALGTQRADAKKLATLLGPDWRDFIPLEGVDRADVDAFLKAWRARHAIETATDGTARVVVGQPSWTLPIPLAKGASGWRFDSRAAAAEIRTRRIGRNELAALQSVRAYHDAQLEYAQRDRDDDGVLEYARRIFSRDGQHDGLYWADDGSGEISPLGPLFGDAARGSDWHGYHFRILEAQGPSAPGGAYGYLLGENMSRGFALVAWPARHGDSGLMSFMISHEGQVFEKDLGPGGEGQARKMARFDPDDSWTQVSAPGDRPR